MSNACACNRGHITTDNHPGVGRHAADLYNRKALTPEARACQIREVRARGAN